MFDRNIWHIIEDIKNESDRLALKIYIQEQESRFSVLVDERNFLRGQNTLALRSIKLDLHPEIRLEH